MATNAIALVATHEHRTCRYCSVKGVAASAALSKGAYNMTQLNDDRATKYETTLSNLSEMIAEKRQSIQELIEDPDWADSVDMAKAELAMLNRVEQDIFSLLCNEY